MQWWASLLSKVPSFAVLKNATKNVKQQLKSAGAFDYFLRASVGTFLKRFKALAKKKNLSFLIRYRYRYRTTFRIV
jgi:hypothetical protein